MNTQKGYTEFEIISGDIRNDTIFTMNIDGVKVFTKVVERSHHPELNGTLATVKVQSAFGEGENEEKKSELQNSILTVFVSDNLKIRRVGYASTRLTLVKSLKDPTDKKPK